MKTRKTSKLLPMWTVTFIDGVTGETRENSLRATDADDAKALHMTCSGEVFGDKVVGVEAA